MTGPKKPRSASAIPAAPAKLNADQLRIAQYFAAMEDRFQGPMLEMMESMARDFPRHKRPALRLVGGAK